MNSELSFPVLPGGTVTFLFTDIEGSTRLLQRLRDRYATLLADQRKILRSAFARWNGHEVDTQGDAFFVAFPRATDAVAAAVEAQRNLARHHWPEEVEVRVRMGLHTGEPLLAEEGYVGIDVHRAARIGHVGHGGQVLLSETTAALVLGELPEGVSLLDLGRHRLKDVTRPERIRQLMIEGLSCEFPLLKSLEALPLELPIEPGTVTLPAFLGAEEKAMLEPWPVFVGRGRELAWLGGFLERAQAGQGSVVFVTGGAGRGKTALMSEFSRQAMNAYPDLLVANGSCTAYTGVGDPYLPFRGVMAMLTGDLEARWATGAITRQHAVRLWEALPGVVRAVVEDGTDLIDVFVPGKGLVSRARAAVGGGAGWLEHLGKLIERERASPGDLEQRNLFEQFEKVLWTVGREHPLVLVLDDLQWADSASTNLLFHIGRGLAGQRILILCAYRPEEVALGRRGVPHPLEKVSNEFKRQYGDVWLDLRETEPEEGIEFIDAYLDSQPNQLSVAFRRAMYEHTVGHPLFTVELLRDLQERGHLIKDGEGRWVEGSELDWNILPARVEGVIEERIGRLEDELRETLTIASVEGEGFTVQVVAQVHQVGERRLLRRLSRELEKRHRLVKEHGEARVGEHILLRYRFTHSLFQQFLYNDLSSGERRLLHGEVAQVLEDLYKGHTESIAVQLAHHYTEAEQADQAIYYLLLAGDRARMLYALEEAIEHYQRALEHLKAGGEHGQAARTLMKLGLTYHTAFEFKLARQAYQEGFALWQRVGEAMPAVTPPPAPHALRLISLEPSTLDPNTCGDLISSRVIGQLFSGLVERSTEMEVVPDVARTWEVQEGGQKYVFHLRDDVRWSDGTPVTARDFEYAWKRLLDPATGSPSASLLYDVKGARAFHQGEVSDPEHVGVRASDEFTLVVELEEPTGYFLHLLAHTVTYPVPRHVVEVQRDAWTEIGNIVTNGPFRLETWKRGQSMLFVRHPEYHGHFKGNVHRVELTMPRDPNARLEMYEANELDILDITYFLPADLDDAQQRHPGEYVSVPELQTLYVEFNVSVPPFEDYRVRQAFAMATDRATLADVILRNHFFPATGGFVPPGMPGHSSGIALPCNPERARQLLGEAGYNGSRVFPPVDFVVPSTAVTPFIAEYLQEQWRVNLGVEITWEAIDLDILLDKLRTKPPHMSLVAWVADYPDPDNFLRVGFPWISTGWRNDDYEQLVEEARRITDQGERMKLYHKADRILIEEAAIMPITYGRQHLLVKPWVRKFPPSVIGGWLWKDVIIEPH